MNKYKNINNIVLFIISIFISISTVGITNFALSGEVDYLNFGTNGNTITLIELSNEDKIKLGCDQVNDQLYQSNSNFSTLTELSSQANNIISEVTSFESIYIANLESIQTTINALPQQIQSDEVNNIFDNKAIKALDKFTTSINTTTDKYLELRSTSAKSQTNYLYNKVRTKTLSSIGFLKKSYNLAISKINATGATSKLVLTTIAPIVDSLLADSQKVITSIFIDFSKLETSVTNESIKISKTELKDNSCIFTIITNEDPIELTIPLVIEPICKAKVSPNEYYIEANQCIKIN